MAVVKYLFGNFKKASHDSILRPDPWGSQVGGNVPRDQQELSPSGASMLGSQIIPHMSLVLDELIVAVVGHMTMIAQR